MRSNPREAAKRREKLKAELDAQIAEQLRKPQPFGLRDCACAVCGQPSKELLCKRCQVVQNKILKTPARKGADFARLTPQDLERAKKAEALREGIVEVTNRFKLLVPPLRLEDIERIVIDLWGSKPELEKRLKRCACLINATEKLQELDAMLRDNGIDPETIHVFPSEEGVQRAKLLKQVNKYLGYLLYQEPKRDTFIEPEDQTPELTREQLRDFVIRGIEPA